MERLKERYERFDKDEQKKNILYNALIGMMMFIPANLMIFFIFPIVQPFLETWIMALISPHAPVGDEFTIASVILFVYYAFFYTFTFTFSFLIGFNLLAFGLMHGLRKIIAVDIIRVREQVIVHKVKTIGALLLGVFIVFLFFMMRIMTFATFMAIWDITNVSDFSTAFLGLMAALQFVVSIWLTFVLFFNYLLGMMVDYLYLHYRRSKDVTLLEIPIYKYDAVRG